MCKRFHLGGVDIPGDILRLGLLRKYYRNIKILVNNTRDADSGCLNCKDLIDSDIGKTSLKLLSDLFEQLNIHLMV